MVCAFDVLLACDKNSMLMAAIIQSYRGKFKVDKNIEWVPLMSLDKALFVLPSSIIHLHYNGKTLASYKINTTSVIEMIV